MSTWPSNWQAIDHLTVAQLRAEPLVARAMDLVLQQAEAAGDEKCVLRDSTATLSDIRLWAFGRYAAACETATSLSYLAELYLLLAVLGEDVSELWYRGESNDVRAMVRASLRATCAPECTCPKPDGDPMLCATVHFQILNLTPAEAARVASAAPCRCACHGTEGGEA